MRTQNVLFYFWPENNKCLIFVLCCKIKMIGLDFWDNLKVANNYNGSYGTELFGNRAVDLIMKHDQSTVSEMECICCYQNVNISSCGWLLKIPLFFVPG